MQMESCPSDILPHRCVSIRFPSAGGAITRLVCARVRKAKIPLSPLLAKAGLTIEQIDDDSCRLKASSQVKFLGSAAEALQDDFLGLRVSRDFDLRRTGLFYYVLASSEQHERCSEESGALQQDCQRGNFAQVPHDRRGGDHA